MSRHSSIPAEPSPGATDKPVCGMAAAFLAFAGGFIIMVIEIVGARLLAGEFGGSFYVWVSQIGVVMVALAAGYYLGGTLADRWGSLRRLAWLLAPAGVLIVAVPAYSPPVFDAIISTSKPRMIQRCDGSTAQVEVIEISPSRVRYTDLVSNNFFEFNNAP